ncbi:MAG: hypothetical protein ACYT04_88315, partial [Nostoc sp.]
MNKSKAPIKQDSIKGHIGDLIKLVQEENSLKSSASVSVTSVQNSLKKATSPRFEIVFAGAFS